ncbi:prolipoprotein diacylglyceryl transferase [Bremerella alba]|uniref:Prolipoprotein diacylglyceryl transferase n=1 Tax=Bremerella alba TaxID=980252 RepID=A0A7V8V4S9_9BACT|nr:prolipoprotein diacylglyceryl transferase family protein [Bremerella alba]MBA2114934.1 Prolipoprotein diacylglyceryl transferase [Bremerella alba]
MTHLAYMAIMLAAIVVGFILLRLFQEKLELAWWEKVGIALGGFCGAMIGAKLPFAIYDWEGLLSGTAWFAHGKTIIAGLLGGYFGVELAKWILDIRTKTGDSYVVPVAVSIGIGRWACFVAGCCFGQACSVPWGVAFPSAPDGGELLRHPAQIYESIFHLACAAVFFVLWKKKMFPGQLFKIYLITYMTYRFFTEWLRPEPTFAFGLTAYQLAALAAIPLFAFLIWRDQKQLSATKTEPSIASGSE